MKSMKQILFSVFLLIGFSSFGFSQTAETKNEKIEISVCRPKITETGRQSSFQFNYHYRVVTDETGLVRNVKEITNTKGFRYLMNDEDVIPCIKNLKLRASEKYWITLFVGTTSEQEFFNVSSKTVNIKILL
jgi:hypothetical protein